MKRVNINLTSLEDHVDSCTLYHISTAYVSPILEAEPTDDYYEYFDASTVTVDNIIQYEFHSSSAHSNPIQVSTSAPDYAKQRTIFV